MYGIIIPVRMQADFTQGGPAPHAKDLDGPLDQQIIDACQFVFRNMTVEAFKHLGRHDRSQYDMETVFEAVANAVAHRDYSIYGSKIRLRMFRTSQHDPARAGFVLDR